MNTIVGGAAVDLALKGQGSPDTFTAIWNFMIRNSGKVGKMQVKISHLVKGAAVTLRSGTLDSLYGFHAGPGAALQRMVADKFFGIDYIGFVSNYLMSIGYWEDVPRSRDRPMEGSFHQSGQDHRRYPSPDVDDLARIACYDR